MLRTKRNEVGNLDTDINVAIQTMLKSSRFHSVYIYGDTSSGKTYSVEQFMKEYKHDAVFVSTHITPLALYCLLYQNNDKIIVIDDLDYLDDTIIAILKAALWDINGSRQINWLTTSKLLEEKGIPPVFDFTGKIIVTCNNENRHRKFEPLLARMLTIHQILKKSDFEDICSKIFKDYGLETYEVFKNNYINAYTEGLHLRNVLKYCEYMKNGFVEQAEKVFSVNEYFKFFQVSQVSLVSSLQKLFEEKFGLGRATFFRYWKKYKELKENGW